MAGQPLEPQRYDDPTVRIGTQSEVQPAADDRSGTGRRAVIAGLGIVCAGTLGYVTASRLQAPPDAAPPAAAPPAGGQSAGQGAGAGQPALVALADVPAGGGTVLSDAKVVVTRDQAGQVRAFSAVCTHQGCTVASVSGGTINCPCHGSKFDAATGRPVAGPAPSPLPPVAVQVRDGAVVRA